jgi:alpha-mannosidase
LLTREISFGGIRFQLGAATKPNALVSRGQTIALPNGRFNRVYLLRQRSEGDQKAAFQVGQKQVDSDDSGVDRVRRSMGQPNVENDGRADPQSVTAAAAGVAPRVRINPYGEMTGIRPAYIKRADIAWFASQRRDAAGNPEPYQYSYLYAYPIDIPAGSRTLVLPTMNESESLR